MRPESLEFVRAAVDGVWHLPPPPDATHRGASIDTRTLEHGQVFVALRGTRTDGHRYLAEAARRGASAAIIDRDDLHRALESVSGRLPLLRVDDARAALTRWARAHRDALHRLRVVAITGSNGKTTTARLVHAALAACFPGRAPIRSFNNELGVPLTLLAATPADGFLVCELGANAPGEIDRLASLVRPDVAVVTSIGRAHLAGFGSVAQIAREKGSILSHVRDGGLGVIPAEGVPVAVPPAFGWTGDGVGPAPARRLIRFGDAADADVRVVRAEHVGGRLEIELTTAGAGSARLRLVLPMIGRHNARNAAAAVAVARWFGVPDQRLVAALEQVEAPPMRLQQLHAGGIDILHDAYNANPDSVLAAIDTLEAHGRGRRRRVAILGPMLELGCAADELYGEVARRLSDAAGVDLVVLVGDALRPMAREVIRRRGGGVVRWVDDAAARAPARVTRLLRRGDVVLVKASRAARLERVVESIVRAGRRRMADRG